MLHYFLVNNIIQIMDFLVFHPMEIKSILKKMIMLLLYQVLYLDLEDV
jgi:hypothetical protein